MREDNLLLSINWHPLLSAVAEAGYPLFILNENWIFIVFHGLQELPTIGY